jgi:hypothetical protein
LHALYSDQLYQKNNVQGCICKLKQEIWFFYKIKCHLTKGSKPFCIYWLQQSYASVCIIETSCSSW